MFHEQFVSACLHPQLQGLHILDSGLTDEDALHLQNQPRLLLTVLHLLVQVHPDVIGSDRVLQNQVCVPLGLQLVLGQQLVVDLQGVSEPSDATWESVDLAVPIELRPGERFLQTCIRTKTDQIFYRLHVGFFRFLTGGSVGLACSFYNVNKAIGIADYIFVFLYVYFSNILWLDFFDSQAG